MRVSFLADGFNLYHSLKAASSATSGQGTRWLDLVALLSGYLKDIDRWATLGDVYYFSALATHLQHRNPGIVERHKTYIAALEATGVRIVLGQFKRASRTCTSCGRSDVRNEEKETDVAIGAHLVERAATSRCDVAFLVSGDSDLVPAIRVARRVAPTMRVGVLFPFARASDDLRSAADHAMKIKKVRYPRHQLPDPLRTTEGRRIRKPGSW